MSNKNYISIMLIGFCILGLILAEEYFFDTDIYVQNLFYTPTANEWMINKALHNELKPYFYQGPKFVMAISGAFCVLWLLCSRKHPALKQHNPEILTLLLSLIFVPLIVAGAKHFTNVYCPDQLALYDGDFPFVRILASYPENFIQTKIGKCFPAGHATVGFAFMALFYCFKTPKYRFTGLFIGLILGWIAAVYQMMRGEHFLSHSLFSCVASFMIIASLNFFIRNYVYRTK